MANKNFWVGILVLTLVFGMAVVGCSDDSADGDTTGTFVLTDIPATYNGKYAGFTAENPNVSVIGCQSVNMSTGTMVLVQISNGRVNIPMWVFNSSSTSVSRYSGNDVFTGINSNIFVIYNTATFTEGSEPVAMIYFPQVAFTNGGVTKSFNDGFISTDY
jgi:hypothetical protein